MTASRRLAGLLLGAALCGAGSGVAVPAGAQAPGSPARGRELFAAKQCARCHVPGGQGGIPALERLQRPQGSFELAGRLWNHAPAMFTTLTQQGVAWPQIEVGEMADLMAYLQATAGGDLVPDVFKGRVTLVRKECLKCHSLRREGGRIAPELAQRRPSYESAPAWAAAMWRHTPAMALKMLEVGVMYPRFVGDEMGNLVAFLRRSAASPTR